MLVNPSHKISLPLNIQAKVMARKINFVEASLGLCIHTEHQKKHHFFRAMLTKIHRSVINHEAHLKNQRVSSVKRIKMLWNCKRSVFKNHINCSLRTSLNGCLFRTFYSYSFNFKGGYVTALLAIVCAELRAQVASSFCEFLKISSCNFTFFTLLKNQANVCFLRYAW